MVWKWESEFIFWKRFKLWSDRLEKDNDGLILMIAIIFSRGLGAHSFKNLRDLSQYLRFIFNFSYVHILFCCSEFLSEISFLHILFINSRFSEVLSSSCCLILLKTVLLYSDKISPARPKFRKKKLVLYSDNDIINSLAAFF